jgi:hypothetical protein
MQVSGLAHIVILKRSYWAAFQVIMTCLYSVFTDELVRNLSNQQCVLPGWHARWIVAE